MELRIQEHDDLLAQKDQELDKHQKSLQQKELEARDFKA